MKNKKLVRLIVVLIICIFISIISVINIKNAYEKRQYEIKQQELLAQKQAEELERKLKEEQEAKLKEEARLNKKIFLNKINDDYDVPKEVMDVICEYNNRYYQCMLKLEYVSCDDLFSSKYEAAISEYANKNLINTRTAYDYDLSIHDGYYDINVKSYDSDGYHHYVDITQDDILYFTCLDGMETGVYGVKSSFDIIETEEGYKIDFLAKKQDYFIMFTEPDPDSISDIQDLYTKYITIKKDEVSEELELRKQAKEIKYEGKPVQHEYDREKASQYSYKYVVDRNPDYYDFSFGGGNCQSFASQMLYYSGIPMDYSGYGEKQWKYYGAEVNENEDTVGRSLSWATVDYFYDYVVANQGDDGMVTDYDINIYYAEPGDILQVGFDNYHRHTTVIAKKYKDIVLLNSNTVNMKNFPMDAYAYNAKRLIKILGYND